MQLLGTKKSNNLSGQKSHATSSDKKSRNLPGQKKIRNLSGGKIDALFGTKKSRILLGQNKIMLPLGTKGNHATFWDKKITQTVGTIKN